MIGRKVTCALIKQIDLVSNFDCTAPKKIRIPYFTAYRIKKRDQSDLFKDYRLRSHDKV